MHLWSSSTFLFYSWSGLIPLQSIHHSDMSDLSKIEISCYSSASMPPPTFNRIKSLVWEKKEGRKGGQKGEGKGQEKKRWTRKRGREENLAYVFSFTSQKAYHSNLTVQFPIILIPWYTCVYIIWILPLPIIPHFSHTMLKHFNTILKHLPLTTENYRAVEMKKI